MAQGSSSTRTAHDLEPTDHALTRRTLTIASERFVDGASRWRSPPVTGFLVVMYGLYGALAWTEAGAGVVGAGRLPMTVFCGGMVVCAVGSALAVHRHGVDSPAYKPWSMLEPAWWTLGSAAMVVAGGSSVSLHWLNIALFVVLMATTWQRHHYYRGLLGVAVSGAVASFALAGQRVDAIVCLMIGLTLLVMQGLSTVTSRQADVQRARAELLSEAAAEQRAQFERERIARDLHDGLGAELTDLLWRSAELDSELADEVSAGLQRSLITLREVVNRGQRRVLEAPSLFRELERVAAGLATSAGASLTLETSGTDAVPADLVDMLVHAVPELVRNALTHGRAHRIFVRVDLDCRCLTVQDDGRWVEQPAGNGLSNLRVRAQSVGGELMRASDDEGTTMTLRWA